MSRAPEQLLAVACPGCGATVAVDRGLVGEAALCPVCPAAFLVPDPGPTPPAERVGPPFPAAPAESRTGVAEPAAAGGTATPLEAVAAGAVSPVGGWPGRGGPGATLPHHGVASVGTPPGHRLTPDERSRRRSRRTLLIMIGGITILLVLAATLGRRPRR